MALKWRGVCVCLAYCEIRKGEGGKGELETADNHKRPQKISFSLVNLTKHKRVMPSHLPEIKLASPLLTSEVS